MQKLSFVEAILQCSLELNGLCVSASPSFQHYSSISFTYDRIFLNFIEHCFVLMRFLWQTGWYKWNRSSINHILPSPAPVALQSSFWSVLLALFPRSGPFDSVLMTVLRIQLIWSTRNYIYLVTLTHFPSANIQSVFCAFSAFLCSSCVKYHQCSPLVGVQLGLMKFIGS